MRPIFDDLDLQIIDRLQDEGRKPFTQVASELNVAEATVRTRVRRLQRLRAVKFVADVDPLTLGLVFANIGIKVQGPALQRTIDAVCAIPETSYVWVQTGTYDLLAEVICRDNDDLFRLLQDLRAIPGIAEVDTMTVLRTVKDQWRYSAAAFRQ